MYSWIASWFTDESTASEQTLYAKNEDTGAEEWTWIEVLESEKDKSLIFIQTNESLRNQSNSNHVIVGQRLPQNKQKRNSWMTVGERRDQLKTTLFKRSLCIDVPIMRKRVLTMRRVKSAQAQTTAASICKAQQTTSDVLSFATATNLTESLGGSSNSRSGMSCNFDVVDIMKNASFVKCLLEGVINQEDYQLLQYGIQVWLEQLLEREKLKNQRDKNTMLSGHFKQKHQLMIEWKKEENAVECENKRLSKTEIETAMTHQEIPIQLRENEFYFKEILNIREQPQHVKSIQEKGKKIALRKLPKRPVYWKKVEIYVGEKTSIGQPVTDVKAFGKRRKILVRSKKQDIPDVEEYSPQPTVHMKPVETSYKIPSWLKRIDTFGDYIHVPEWLKRINVCHFHQSCGENNYIDIPKWIQRMDADYIFQKHVIDCENELPHWMKRIELFDNHEHVNTPTCSSKIDNWYIGNPLEISIVDHTFDLVQCPEWLSNIGMTVFDSLSTGDLQSSDHGQISWMAGRTHESFGKPTRAWLRQIEPVENLLHRVNNVCENMLNIAVVLATASYSYEIEHRSTAEAVQEDSKWEKTATCKNSFLKCPSKLRKHEKIGEKQRRTYKKPEMRKNKKWLYKANAVPQTHQRRKHNKRNANNFSGGKSVRAR